MRCKTRPHRLRTAVAVATFLAAAGTTPAAPAADEEAHRVRPTWGNEALWDYWKFGDDYLPKTGWRVVPGAPEGAANLIDGDAGTAFSAAGKDAYEVTIDLGQTRELGAFTVVALGRPDENRDARMARYQFRVGETPDGPGNVVAEGPFKGEPGTETVVAFPPARGRFVTLRAVARPDGDKGVSVRELSLVGAREAKAHLAAAEQADASRKARWRDRNSGPAVEALARDFLGQIFTTREDIYRTSNLQNREPLLEIGKLREAGKHAEGLKVFRDYYFDKLRRPQAFGLHANDVNPFGRGAAGVGGFPESALDGEHPSAGLAKDVARADDLMRGRMTLGNGSRVEIGEPGAVDWSAPGPPYGYRTAHKAVEPYRELWWGIGFRPLFAAYMVTKKEAYLKRWLDYMDDWALNESFLTGLHPVVNHDNSSYPVVTTIRMFAGMAGSLPFDSEAVHPATFARVMRKLTRDSTLNEIVYMRSNPNAWTPGAGRMLFAMLIDEFKVAPLYFRETRRRNIEDVNVVQGLRDGTEAHQWPGYNHVLLINAAALRLMDARETLPVWAQPVWERDLHTPAWQQELRDHLARRAGYLVHWTTPQGEYPLVTHHEPPTERQKLREDYGLVPQVLDDPVNARIYSTLFGDGSAGAPPYTSEWFPYGGYSIARDGWGPDDGYAAMFCSPRPGHGSVGSGCKNNAFTLAGYGLDLLADDLVHSYIRPTSPVQVDGKRQFFDYDAHTAAWPAAHRGGTVAWSEPAPWRWHASADFDLMEGVYSGPYANDNRDPAGRLDGVSHQRLALHARRARLWVITDRLRAAGRHDYEQLWYFPLKKKELAGFAPGEVETDPAARTIKTRRKGTDAWWSWHRMNNVKVRDANVSLYQFADVPLAYDSSTRKSNEELYDFQRVGVRWRGEGDQQIVTAVFPRKPSPDGTPPDGARNDLTSIQAAPAVKGTTGFRAVTPDGTRVSYSAASGGAAAPLGDDDVRITGEALLLVRGAGGKVSGVALGCKTMALRGREVRVGRPDFEFDLPATLDTAGMTTVAIDRPISPVKIWPEADVFADALEVRLECATPAVFLTYTLDGTEPTPRSARYGGPFTITRGCALKTRAYRPGVVENPPQSSGTQATATSFARFTKTLPYAPSDVAPRSAGLGYEYFEGDWKDMWLALDTLKPAATGAVPSLFDLAAVPASNPPVGARPAPRSKAYTFRYSGFLKVPRDGVYTLRAPRELVYPDTVAGYELQVSLGHATVNDAGVVRREGGLSLWYPSTRLHGLGTWSVPLKAGFHELKVVYLDFRTDGPRRLNRDGPGREFVWAGERPALRVSGPGLPEQPIPASWLWH